MKSRLYVASLAIALIAAAFVVPQDAVNKKCPLSGEDVDAKCTVTLSRTVGCCSDECAEKLGKLEPGPKAAVLSKIAAKPVNDKCPISKKAIDATKTVVHKGETIAFCCGGCPAKFNDEKAKDVVKTGKPENDKCGGCGKAEVSKKVAPVSVTVAFCCGKCKAKFEKDPAAHAEKIK